MKDIESLKKRFAYLPTQSTSPLPKRPVPKRSTPTSQPSLKQLPELLSPDLKLIFCGFNPSIKSSETGHRFAHRSNCFWKLLHDSGIVEEQLNPEDDVHMPQTHSIGFTDLVRRPTRGIEDVSMKEMRQNVPLLIDKINKYRPRVVCLVGKGIWDHVVKVLKLEQNKFVWGVQEQRVFQCVCFVVPSTSGLVRIGYEEKLRIWKELAALLR